jgi:hypothetical protein
MMEKLNLSPSLPNIVISEDDGMLDDLLAADSPVAKVQCTEDDDFDLDELLRKKDDDDEPAAQTNLSPHSSLSTSPPPSSTLSPLRPLSGRNIFNQCDQKDTNSDVATAAALQQSPPTLVAAAAKESGPVSTAVVKQAIISSPTPRSPILASEEGCLQDANSDVATAAAENESGSVSPESSPTAVIKQAIISSPTPRSPILASEEGCLQDANSDVSTAAASQLPPPTAAAAAEKESGPVIKQAIISSPTPRSPILAEEDEDDEGLGHWINPPPAQPGDFLNNSVRRVPSKSILKKVSSYGNFDAPISPGKSSPRRNSEESAAMKMGKKKSSFLNFSMGSTNSNHSEISGGSSYGVGVGLDLGDSSSIHSPRSLSVVSKSKITCAVDENSVHPPIVANFLPQIPVLTSNAEDADRAAGLTSNSSDLSSSGKKMNRSVSFHSVDVREYDRTIGDNPSCRSGPPVSLDWSYSKKYEQPKALDEYEREREPDRVKNLRGLHINKYRRRNLLSFNWGHSEEDMKSARQETKKLQRQRSLTQTLLPFHLAHEAFISVKDFVAKKRGEAESPKQELERVTSELAKSTKDAFHHNYS